MAVLNYTTSIDVFKTLGEIQQKLATFDVSGILMDYKDGQPVAISFILGHGTEAINYRLPCNYHKLHKRLEKQKIAAKFKTEEQALRVAWRTLKQWVEAQIELVETDLVTVHEVFLPYQLMENNKTLFQNFEERGLKLLK